MAAEKTKLYANQSPRCRSCQYVTTFASSKIKHCDYIGATGKMRNSSVENCDKYMEKNDQPIKLHFTAYW
jgi:hypothetical protein